MSAFLSVIGFCFISIEELKKSFSRWKGRKKAQKGNFKRRLEERERGGRKHFFEACCKIHWLKRSFSHFCQNAHEVRALQRSTDEEWKKHHLLNALIRNYRCVKDGELTHNERVRGPRFRGCRKELLSVGLMDALGRNDHMKTWSLCATRVLGLILKSDWSSFNAM